MIILHYGCIFYGSKCGEFFLKLIIGQIVIQIVHIYISEAGFFTGCMPLTFLDKFRYISEQENKSQSNKRNIQDLFPISKSQLNYFNRGNYNQNEANW